MKTDDEPPRSLSLPSSMPPYTEDRNLKPTFPRIPCSWGSDHISSVQFSSVTQSCPTLCDPMNCSTPGLLVHHELPEFTQTHVHRVCDAIQPSHPLLSPFPPAPNPSQHPKYCSFSLNISPSVNTQDWSPLGWTGWISLQSRGLSRVFSNTTIQKHRFFGTQRSSQSNSHIHT